jgi:hypothetical protein
MEMLLIILTLVVKLFILLAFFATGLAILFGVVCLVMTACRYWKITLMILGGLWLVGIIKAIIN